MMGNSQDLISWLKLARKSQSPTKIRDIQEIALAISAKSLSPKLLGENWLSTQGIVPQDWSFKVKPVFSPSLVELNFQNGLKIVARGNTITFIEIIGNKDLEQINAPKVLGQFVKVLSQLEYQTLQVSPRRLISLPGSLDAPRKYITETLLASGSWQEFGNSPLQAALNFVYQLQRCQMRLNIKEAKIQKPGQPVVAALFFSGYFEYNFAKTPKLTKLEKLTEQIENWTSDFETFNYIINQKFLG